MQSPSRTIHIYKCVLVCAWFVLSHRSTWCGGGANRERNRQIVVALMCAQSSVNRIHARWKEQKKAVSLDNCLSANHYSGTSARVSFWPAHTQSCAQAIKLSIKRSDEAERNVFSHILKEGRRLTHT